MKLATWNVNSIRAREARLLAWLERHDPDVLCLQELKVEGTDFPMEPLRELGYEAAAFGQPTYNGVAILARHPLEDVTRGFDDGEDDEQARAITAVVQGVRVSSLYIPNGQFVGSKKWTYKGRWFERLLAWLERTSDPAAPHVLCGDFNAAVDERDVHDPPKWESTVLYHPDARGWMQALFDWGLVDTFRIHHQEPGHYSWWDYRRLSFEKKEGVRIDYVLATAPLAERCTSASIDREERKGKKPSDHAPVIAEFDGVTSPA